MKTAVLASIPAPLDYPGRPCAIGLGLALVLGFAQGAVAQQNPLTAIDIALEPDVTMLQHAKDANARLLKSFPKGFTLDKTHHPHDRSGQAFQSACDDRRRNGNLFEQDVGRTIRLVHVLGDWRIGLSAWHFWHSSEGTEGVAADALRRGTKNDWKRAFSSIAQASA